MMSDKRHNFYQIREFCTDLDASIYTMSDPAVDYWDVVNILRYRHEESLYYSDGDSNGIVYTGTFYKLQHSF